MKLLISMLAAGSLILAGIQPASANAATTARQEIDAGNQAWIDGMKSGNVAMIIATYSEDAVDCSSAGDCIKGRQQIEEHMKSQLAKFGRARTAAVQSWGSSQHGDLVYEWGQAEATFDGGKKVVDKYLTVWQKQADGSWKIFRNLVLPEK